MILTPFEKALIAHLAADWIFQNDWMAQNKMSLRHPAAWTHAAIHALGLGLALGWQAGIVLGFVHLLIDTRIPVTWWIRVFKKSSHAPDAGVIAIGLDQTMHLVTIAMWIVLAKG